MATARAIPARPQRGRRHRRWTQLAAALKRASRRSVAAWRRVPLAIQLLLVAILLVGLWWPVNLAYQVIRKPSELLLPVSGTWTKSPTETWAEYGALFRRYATPAVTPELLAALAQVESAGDPIASTYWRWRFSWNPLAIYRPASSAVGMFQMTDAAFAEAQRFCIRDHRVVETSSESGGGSCWFSSFTTRLFPSTAIELAAVYLDRKLTQLGDEKRLAHASPQQRQNLLTVIHLCGSEPAADYLHRGFRLTRGERCGDQDVAAYLARVNAAKQEFQRLAQAE